jgi:hypothetical protein
MGKRALKRRTAGNKREKLPFLKPTIAQQMPTKIFIA